MVHDLFNVLLNSVCKYFVEKFCIYVHQRYWPVIFFSCGVPFWFWYQGNAGLIKLVWKHSFLFNVLKEFEKDWY